MGVALDQAYLMNLVLPNFEDRYSLKLCTIGVQDCYFNYNDLLDFLDHHNFQKLKISEKEIVFNEGFMQLSDEDWATNFSDCIHQKSFFNILGFDPEAVDALDLSDIEGANVIHDLNKPLKKDYFERYDIVYDSGTCEHVFSASQALKNMMDLCKIGGLVIQVSPVDMINHGFVNFNAHLMKEAYEVNGFETRELLIFAVPNSSSPLDHILLFDPFELQSPIPAGYILVLFGAFKKICSTDLVVPIQREYEHLYKLRASKRNKACEEVIKLRRSSNHSRLIKRKKRKLISNIAYWGYLVFTLGLKKSEVAKRLALNTDDRLLPDYKLVELHKK